MTVLATQTLARALKLANDAVSSDTSGDYSQAVLNYQECLHLLDGDELVGMLSNSEQERSRVSDMITEYQDRMEFILTELTTKQLVPEWQFQELSATEMSLPSDYEHPPPPASVDARAYFLIRRFKSTMSYSGAHISDNVYVSRDVWFSQAPGVKLMAVETKYTCCDTLLLWLMKLKELDISDMESLTKELDLFEEQLIIIQTALSRKLSHVEESKSPNAKKIISSMSKQLDRMQQSTFRDKGDQATLYLRLLYKVFSNCQFLDDWTKHFNELPATPIVWSIQNQLKRVAEFMLGAVCAMTMADFRQLLVRHLKRTRAVMESY